MEYTQYYIKVNKLETQRKKQRQTYIQTDRERGAGGGIDDQHDPANNHSFHITSKLHSIKRMYIWVFNYSSQSINSDERSNRSKGIYIQ